jgi:hypothetical protein
MSDQRISSHWPDYFQVDCRVGTTSAAPFAEALDAASMAFSERSAAAGFCGRPERWSAERVRAALKALGFPVAVLSDEETQRLYASRVELLSGSGGVGALRVLAAVYLGVADVARGALAVATPLPERGVSALVLGDVPSRYPTVVVRTADDVPNDRVDAFLRAARCFVPEGTVLRVFRRAERKTIASRGFRSAHTVPLVERRI